MASTNYSAVPSVDFFGKLGVIGDSFSERRKEAERKALLSGAIAPDGGVDYEKLMAGALRAGDTQTALMADRMRQDRRDFDWRKSEAARAQSNADRTFGIQERAATRQETPAQLQLLRAAGIDPASAEGRKALFPRTDTPISATDKKAIFEAEDAVPQLKGTLEALSRALELNDKTFTGFGAEFFGKLGTGAAGALGNPNLASDQAKATTEWSKIMGPQALETMAATLKGATTDFELRKFTEMLADPSTPADVRKGVIQRMQKLAERQLQIKEARIKDLRGGTYFQPQGGARPSASDPLAMARDAILKGADPNAVRQRLQQNGIDPSGL